MNTIWILILFYNTNSVAAAEFTNEKACKSAIVSASIYGGVKAVCVPKEIK